MGCSDQLGLDFSFIFTEGGVWWQIAVIPAGLCTRQKLSNFSGVWMIREMTSVWSLVGDF